MKATWRDTGTCRVLFPEKIWAAAQALGTIPAPIQGIGYVALSERLPLQRARRFAAIEARAAQLGFQVTPKKTP